MTPSLDRATLGRLARQAGLAVAGVTTPEPFHDVADYAVEHIERGHLRGLSWFTAERARQSADPRTLHPGVRSVVAVAIPYWNGPAHPEDDELRGRIARFAWGGDYHNILKRRMRALVDLIAAELGRDLDTRQLVDTARVFDRAVAARAGVGWYGKNSMIIVPGHGSWVMLGDLYLDIDIEPDRPLARDCGRCTFCMDRCPTGAIVEPYRIDAPRCISYLTIEERGPIPRELRPFMGNWVFGCDICQDVCPYTGAASEVDDKEFGPASIENQFPSLEFLTTMTEDQFRATFSGTAVTRTKRRGMARNAAIALGNSGDQRAEALLNSALSHDEPLVRGHAAWALKHLIGDDASRTLNRALKSESDAYVQEEICLALEHSTQFHEPGRTIQLQPVAR